jgi:hypothetical protein
MTDPSQVEAQLRAENAQLKAENLRLVEKALRLEDFREKQHQLEAQLSKAVEDKLRSADDCLRAEAQTTSLSRLFVASYRLHETLDRAELMKIIEEIVANMIGSEEMAVFQRREGSNTLVLLSSVGEAAARLKTIEIGSGHIGRVAASGQVFVREPGSFEADAPGEERLTACVPLRLSGEVIGALAIFALLPQKRAYDAIDHELFELLATQGGMALYCSKLEEAERNRTNG